MKELPEVVPVKTPGFPQLAASNCEFFLCFPFKNHFFKQFPI